MERLLVFLAVISIGGCSAGSVGLTPSPDPSTYASGALPTPAVDPAPPASTQPSAPVAVPDPPGGLPQHGAGEEVTIGDTVLTFTGLAQRAGAAYATFEAQPGTLDGAHLIVGDSILSLQSTDGGYEAGPIDPEALTSVSGGVITLVVGETLIPFSTAIGPVR